MGIITSGAQKMDIHLFGESTYFASVRYSDIEGHKNSILKFCV